MYSPIWRRRWCEHSGSALPAGVVDSQACRPRAWHCRRHWACHGWPSRCWRPWHKWRRFASSSACDDASGRCRRPSWQPPGKFRSGPLRPPPRVLLWVCSVASFYVRALSESCCGSSCSILQPFCCIIHNLSFGLMCDCFLVAFDLVCGGALCK